MLPPSICLPKSDFSIIAKHIATVLLNHISFLEDSFPMVNPVTSPRRLVTPPSLMRPIFHPSTSSPGWTLFLGKSPNPFPQKGPINHDSHWVSIWTHFPHWIWTMPLTFPWPLITILVKFPYESHSPSNVGQPPKALSCFYVVEQLWYSWAYWLESSLQPSESPYLIWRLKRTFSPVVVIDSWALGIQSWLWKIRI